MYPNEGLVHFIDNLGRETMTWFIEYEECGSQHEIVPIKGDSAGRMRYQTGDGPDNCALAGRVGANDADKLASFDMQRDAVQHIRCAITGDKIADLQELVAIDRSHAAALPR